MLYRPSFGLSPWREMERLRREMNRLLSGYGSSVTVASGFPAMNVWTNEDGAVITAELPGIDPKGVDISVNNDTLTVTGNRQPEELPQDATYHRRERGSGRFSRSFQLPLQVEAGKVMATFERGILQITLPRAEADKPRKIVVKTA